MGQDAVPMMLPLLPMGTQVGATAKPAPLKTNSLSRLEDLQQHLRRCDDPAYLNRYVKVSACVKWHGTAREAVCFQNHLASHLTLACVIHDCRVLLACVACLLAS